MASLLDELRADQPPRKGCAVCEWLRSRPDAEKAEWAEAMSDRSFSVTGIHRAMAKRGFSLTDSPVGTHRRDRHVVD